MPGLCELSKAQCLSLAEIWPTRMLIMESSSLWEELVRARKVAHFSQLSNGCDREGCCRHLLPSPLFVEIFQDRRQRERKRLEPLLCVTDANFE